MRYVLLCLSAESCKFSARAVLFSVVIEAAGLIVPGRRVLSEEV